MDIDFADDRRDEVIEYVVQRYGRDRVAQIITFNVLKAKAVIRDVGRVLGMAFGDVDKIAKLVPDTLNITLDDAFKQSPPLAEAVKGRPEVAELWQIAKRLEGLARHAGKHAAGVVISDEPLMEHVPLYRDPKSEEIITQYPMGPIEKLGLLKMDFLGLRTLTVIANTVRLIEESRSLRIDPERIPLDDARTYQLLADARTFGVFQLESTGMRNALRQLRPERLEDVIAMVALYRPGPMEMIPDFIARRHGRVKSTYEHPVMEKHLQETYGIMVYQEQVLKIASDMAEFSMSEADDLRKAMGKKIPALMAEQRPVPGRGQGASVKEGRRAGLRADGEVRGLRLQQAHTTAYGIVAYQTACFKPSYPVGSWPRSSRPRWRTPTRSSSTWTSAGPWASACSRRTSTSPGSRSPWMGRRSGSGSARSRTSARRRSRSSSPPASSRAPSCRCSTSAGGSTSSSSTGGSWRAWSSRRLRLVGPSAAAHVRPDGASGGQRHRASAIRTGLHVRPAGERPRGATIGRSPGSLGRRVGFGAAPAQ
jgi:hypothetical protein